jgi:hypothetical protein
MIKNYIYIKKILSLNYFLLTNKQNLTRNFLIFNQKIKINNIILKMSS